MQTLPQQTRKRSGGEKLMEFNGKIMHIVNGAKGTTITIKTTELSQAQIDEICMKQEPPNVHVKME